MSIFIDPHIHTSARTLDEMAAMKAAGIVAVIEPAFWRAELQGKDTGLRDYFNRLVGWERFRASQSDLCHYCTIGLNPREAGDEMMTTQALEVLPVYAANEGVVAIGEIGFETMSDKEEAAFRMQLQIAKKNNLPVLIRAPQQRKKEAVLLSMRICEEEGMEAGQVIIGHVNEETMEEIHERGYWAALSLCAVNGMTCEQTMAAVQRYSGERLMINSAAEWGWGHPLAVPTLASVMRERGFSSEMVHAVCYANALQAYSYSGRFAEADWMSVVLPISGEQEEADFLLTSLTGKAGMDMR